MDCLNTQVTRLCCGAEWVACSVMCGLFRCDVEGERRPRRATKSTCLKLVHVCVHACAFDLKGTSVMQ